jgi:hypothetical protein
VLPCTRPMRGRARRLNGGRDFPVPPHDGARRA